MDAPDIQWVYRGRRQTFWVMEELEVTLGQRSLPSVHGDQTTATSYAGMGSRHLLIVADGADGPVVSRLAAQVAASAAMARFRASVFPRTDEQLTEAFAEAHQAVRRGALGSHAEGQAGASMIAVVVEPRGVTAARVGGGRVYVIDEDGVVHALYRGPTEGYVGDRSTEAEVVNWPRQLGQGARVIILSEHTARGVLADLEQLAANPPPQLAAARLADAARRRGQYEPLAVQVVEIQKSSFRPMVHPAIQHLSREDSRTMSADGRWLGGSGNLRGRSRRARQEAGWVLWFFLALLFGAAAGLIIHSPAEPDPSTIRASFPDPPADVSIAPPVDVVDPPKADTTPPAPIGPTLPASVASDIQAVFDRHPARGAARSLKVYITNQYARRGSAVFDDLELWILANPNEHVVATLLEILKKRGLKKTHRWVNELLPRIYANSPP